MKLYFIFIVCILMGSFFVSAIPIDPPLDDGEEGEICDASVLACDESYYLIPFRRGDVDGDSTEVEPEDAPVPPPDATTGEPPTQQQGGCQLSQAGLQFIIKAEGKVTNEQGKHIPYNDDPQHPESSHCTIGYGHVLHAGLCDGTEAPWTEEQATRQLREDIRAVERALFQDGEGRNPLVKDEVEKKLKQHQCDSLISLVYNIGTGNFERSRAREQLNRERIYGESGFLWEAFHPIHGFVRSGGRILEGLQDRRNEERELWFRDYKWDPDDPPKPPGYDAPR